MDSVRMEGGGGDQMCPVCTLYLRPGMTLQDHLFTHPKDQVIEALVRLAMSGGGGGGVGLPPAMAAPAPTLNTNNHQQFTAITYRQFQTLTTSVPEPATVPMMLNPCLMNQGVIRSSVPLLSYPYYPAEQPNPAPFHAQTTQTTQTQTQVQNPFDFAAGCDVASQDDRDRQDPFQDRSDKDSEKEGFESSLGSVEVTRESLFLNEKDNGQKPTEISPPSQERDPFDGESARESRIDPFVEDDLESDHDDEDRAELTRLEQHEELMDASHSLGTVISNTHRLIADPTLDYEHELQADELDYGEQGYDMSPAHSPVSDVSNWSSGSGLRVRRDLNIDEQSSIIMYVQPDSNAAEYVTSDPYGDEVVQPPRTSPAHLTNLDEVNYPLVLNYSTNTDQLAGSGAIDKEDNSGEPLNIHSDELMPPRGELSGQESLGNTENSVWGIPEHGEPSVANYPLLDKDRWQMLTSAAEQQLADSLANDAPRNHSVKCLDCDMKFTCVKERRVHVQAAHGTPKHTQVKTEAAPRAEGKLCRAQLIRIKQERFVKQEPGQRACSDCALEFQTIKELRTHRRAVHEVKRKCGTCGQVFPDSLQFKEHIAKVHPIECTVCGKSFPNRGAANAHAKCHLKHKPFQCKVCDKSFLTRIRLNEHNNVHSGEAPFKCPMCDQTFRRQSNLIQHKNFFHLRLKKKIKDYFCHCGEIFHSIKKLQWHRETHDSKPKQCMYCSERYVHATSLTRHIRHAHDSTYLPKATRSLNVLCPVCKITCIRSSLAQHLKIHTGDRHFTCNICSKEFTTNWNLQMHRWTHASRSSKPFKCKLCKSAFYMLASYQAHMRSHRNIRPYTCNYCGRQFIRKYNCVRHVKEHETNKSYCCAVCNKTFHRSYYLTEHMRTHTGAKPYTCHICSKTSSTKSNHNKHVRTHHAREPVNTEG